MRYPHTRRGAQPKATADSLALFTLDAATKSDILGGRALSTPGFTSAPTVSDGIIGNRLEFGGSAFAEAAAAAGDVAAFQSSTWTFTTWVRVLVAPSTKMTYCSFAGDAIDGDATQNALAECSLRIVGGKLVPALLWEDAGEGNVECIPTVDGVDLDLGVWYAITWRRIAADEVDLLINGVLQEQFTGLTSNANGTNAYWHFGAASQGASLLDPLTGDMCGVHVSTIAETDDKLLEDFRRGIPVCADWDTVVHRRAFVEDQGAELADMTSREGVDWVRGISLQDSQSAQVVPVGIKLLREYKNLSLSLLRTDSKMNKADVDNPLDFDPLLEAGKDFLVQWARVPVGIEPEDRDWQTKTRGEIDTIDFGVNPCTVEAQDLGAKFVQKEIDDLVEYSGVIEVVAQDIIDDNGGLDTLYSRDAIGFNVTAYTPQRGPLFGGLRTLYGQAAGADVRYLWDPITDMLRLTAYLPKIANTVPAFAFNERRIRKIQRARSSRDTVRNSVSITFGDEANLDSNGNRLPATVVLQDAASIADYGEISFTHTESQTGLIRNTSDATDLAEATLETLKDPRLDVDVLLGISPELEVNDVGLLEGDDLHWTGFQRLACASLATEMPGDARDGQTKLTVAGKPSLGPPRWLDVEARPGQARHPINEAGNLQERFDGDLNPITAWFQDWVDIVAGGRFLKLKNHNFATYTRALADYPPDGWQVGTGTWQVDVFADIVTNQSGGNAIRFGADGTSIISQQFGVDYGSGRFLLVAGVHRLENAGNTTTLTVNFYDRDRVFISSSAAQVFGFPAFTAVGTWIRFMSEPIVPPAGSAFAEVELEANIAGGVNYVDAVAPLYGSAEADVQLTSDQTDADPTFPVPLDTWTQVKLDNENRDWVDNFDSTAGSNYFVAPEQGLYEVQGNIECQLTSPPLSGATLDSANARIEVDVGSGFTVASIGSASTEVDTINALTGQRSIKVQVSAVLRLDKDDRIALFGRLRASGTGGGDTWGFRATSNTKLDVKLRSTE